MNRGRFAFSLACSFTLTLSLSLSLWFRLLPLRVGACQVTRQALQLLSGVDILDNASRGLEQIASGVAALSFDKVYVRSRAEKQDRVAHLGEGLAAGGEAFAKGVLRGITGIFTKPVEGALKASATTPDSAPDKALRVVEGFFKGVGRGIIGAAAQPVAGVLDLIAKTTEGVSASVDSVGQAIKAEARPERRRLPLAVAGDRVVRPYDEAAARGQMVLVLAQSGTYFGHRDIFRTRGQFARDAYETHAAVDKRRLVVLTDRRVLYLAPPLGSGGGAGGGDVGGIGPVSGLHSEATYSAIWSVEWGDLRALELAPGKGAAPGEPPSRLLLHLTEGAAGASVFNGAQGPPARAVRCLPGTRQAAQLMKLVVAVRSKYYGRGAAASAAAAGHGGAAAAAVAGAARAVPVVACAALAAPGDSCSAGGVRLPASESGCN